MEEKTAEPISVRLGRENIREDIEVRPLADGHFEILETPMLYGRVGFKDIVRLRPLNDGTYRVAKIVRRPFQHYFPLVPTEYAYSRSIFDFYRWLESRGGEWESAVGCFLFIHLPQGDNTIDEVLAELAARVEAFNQSEERKRIIEAGDPGREEGEGLVKDQQQSQESD